VARRQRSVSLWQQAILALEAGDADRVVQLTRQRIEESAQEAVQQLDLKGKP
jgi:DNA-binding GntR family transcriptional regulator